MPLDTKVNDVYFVDMVHDDDLSPRQRRKRVRRREEILETALQLVSEGGLEGCTIHALARQLDLTPGALYRYFPSKGALIADVQRHVMEGVLDDLEARMRAKEPELSGLPAGSRALARVLELGRGYAAQLSSRPRELALLATMTADPRRLVPDEEIPRLVPVFTRLFTILEGLFSAAFPGRSANELRSMALVLFATTQGLLNLEKLRPLPGFGVDPRVEVDNLVAGLLLRWGAEASDLEPVLGQAAPASAQRSSPKKPRPRVKSS